MLKVDTIVKITYCCDELKYEIMLGHYDIKYNSSGVPFVYGWFENFIIRYCPFCGEKL